MSVLLFNNQCKRSEAQRSDVCLHFVMSAKEVVLSPVSGWWSVGLSAGSNKNYQADFHEAWMEDGPHQPLVWHCERGCFFNSLINFSGIMYGSWWKKLSWAPWGFRYLWVSTIWHRSKSFYQGWSFFSRNSHQFNFDFYQPIILPQHTGDQDSIYIVLLC